MTSRGRINELKQLHAKVSGGGNCVSLKELQKRLKRPIQTNGLPTNLYIQDFVDLFQEETCRLQALDRKLSENIAQYSLKQTIHREFYKQMSYLKDKGPSRLDIVVENAQDLKSNQTYAAIKNNNQVAYKTMLKTKTHNPAWNERYTLGVAPHDKVTIEIIDGSSHKPIAAIELQLNSLEDQLVHSRNYNLAQGKLNIRAQWTHNQITFHKTYADKYELWLFEEQTLLEKVSGKLNELFSLSGDALLVAWLCDQETQRKVPGSKLCLQYESRQQSTVSSLVTTPTSSTVATRYSRPIDLAEIIPPRGGRVKELLKGNGINFFSIGFFRAKSLNRIS